MRKKGEKNLGEKTKRGSVKADQFMREWSAVDVSSAAQA